MTSPRKDATLSQWLSHLASLLDRRSPPLVWLNIGAIRPEGCHKMDRRCRPEQGHQTCYTTITAAGKLADRIAEWTVNQTAKLLSGHWRLTSLVTIWTDLNEENYHTKSGSNPAVYRGDTGFSQITTSSTTECLGRGSQ